MAAPNGTLNALAASDSVLSFFWDLASLDQEVRDKAALGLTQELLASQQQFEQESELESDAGENEGGTAPGNKGRAVAQALRRCSPLMSYGMKRLVRGLGSSREGARQGFALALTLVLGKAGERGCISAQDTATVISSVLEAASSAKGSEQRDMLLGQVFGLGALVRSGMSIDAECGRAVAASLVSVAEKKSFLREVSAAVLLELAERVDDAVLAAIVQGAEGLKAWLTAPPASATPEALMLAVRLWSRLPASLLSSCQLLPAGCSRPPPATLFTAPMLAAGKAAGPAAAAFFSPAHLEALVPVLRASTHAHPRLHPLWPTLLALLIPGFHPDKEQRQSESGQNATPRTAELGALWGSVVETELFASSHERKYLGFMLFAVLLPHLKSEHVPLVFTPNFLRCLSNNLTKQDNYLHSTAKKCLERITAFADRAEPSVRVAVSLALQRHGGAGFEKLTKAKKAGGMMEGMGGDALQGQISQLKQTFNEAAAASGPSAAQGAGSEDEENEEGEEGGAGSDAAPPRQQQWAVEQLCTLCKQPAAGLTERRSVLHFLALHAFFRIDPKAAAKSKDKELRAAAQCSPQLSPAARRLCAARLLTLTDSLSKPPGKQQPQQQAAADGSSAPAAARHDYLSDVVGYVSGVAQLPAATLLAVEAAEGAEGAMDALRPLTEKLTKRLQADPAAGSTGGEEGARLRALRHLAGLLALQLLGDPAAVDGSVAHDLAHIYAAAFEGAEPEGESDEEGAAPHWMDTLVDVLLALLAPTSTALPSAPLREAVEHVFRVFCDQLTPTGMQDLLRIISRPVEQSEGNEEEDGVFDSEEEEGEGSDADASSDEDAGGSDEDEEEEGGSSSEEEEEGAPAKAAGKGGDAGGGSGSGSDSDESEGMDDEAMFRMDAKLAAYFAAARDSKRGVRAQREELLNFKMRVAALLEALVKKAPASPLLPTAVLPLLSTLAACSKPGSGGGGQEALAQRLAGLIQSKLCKSRAEASGAAAGAWVEEEAAAALRRCLYLASRSPDKRVLQAAGAAYQYLLRVAAGAAGGLEKSKQAVESVTAALGDLFTKKRSRLAKPFFEGMMRPPLSAGPLLVPLLLEHSLSARSDYLRGEAAALLAAAVKARSRDVDSAAARLSARAGAVLLDALRRPVPGKAQRQVEALKAACALVESLRRGAGGSGVQALGPKLAAEVEEALGAAQQAEQAPKVAGQLQRLGELLRSGAGGAAGGKQAAAAGGEGDKKKAKPKAQQPKAQAQQQQQQQGGGAASPGKRKQAGGKGAAGKRPRA